MSLNLVFPKKCLNCGKGKLYICSSCLGGIRCIGWYNGNFVIWKYEGVIKKAILTLKYRFVTDLATELAQAAVKRLTTSKIGETNCVLIPVPLHKTRLRQRGFNQAEILGKKLAKGMGWDFQTDLVVRVKKTKPQVETKTRIERLTNLTGAFEINKYKLSSKKPLVVFDDVATTGSTIREIKNELEKSGAKRVWGITLAS